VPPHGTPMKPSWSPHGSTNPRIPVSVCQAGVPGGLDGNFQEWVRSGRAEVLRTMPRQKACEAAMNRSVQCAVLPAPRGFRAACLGASSGAAGPNSAASRRSGAPTGAHPLHCRTIRPPPPPARAGSPRQRLLFRGAGFRPELWPGPPRPRPTRHQAHFQEPSGCRSGSGLLPTGLHTLDGKWALIKGKNGAIAGHDVGPCGALKN
jgi:hypothetical protein